jgi:hypothetical protein
MGLRLQHREAAFLARLPDTCDDRAGRIEPIGDGP